MDFWDIVWFIIIFFAFMAYLMVLFMILSDLMSDDKTSVGSRGSGSLPWCSAPHPSSST